MDKRACNNNQDLEIRKGPWTMEEDLILINYIANHGEGVWNSLARSAGLKRTGKSCRLRWLNYLRPDVRRGNITPEEHLLIMELHAKWGNRWSKIAKHLPGRTDNEIKNFWRTRIQKHLKQGTDQNQMAKAGCSNSSSDQLSCTNQAGMALAATAAAMTNSSNCGPTVESYSLSANSFAGNMETAALIQGQEGFPTESDDTLWTVEDLWSMHLLNGD